MSKLAKKLIKVPQGVNVEIKEGKETIIYAKGPKGDNSYIIKMGDFNVKMNKDKSSIGIEPKTSNLKSINKQVKALWGTYWSNINNLIQGVSLGYVKELEIQGLGFKAEIINNDLKLNIGYTNPIIIKTKLGIKFETNKNVIKVIGVDKQQVGEIANKIRRLREPDPYKWVGVKYVGETLIKKLGKKLATTK